MRTSLTCRSPEHPNGDSVLTTDEEQKSRRTDSITANHMHGASLHHLTRTSHQIDGVLEQFGSSRTMHTETTPPIGDVLQLNILGKEKSV